MNEPVRIWPSASNLMSSIKIWPMPMGDAAVDLAVQQQRIDHGADVVDDVVVHDLDGAGVLVDFELADVHAVGIARDLA